MAEHRADHPSSPRTETLGPDGSQTGPPPLGRPGLRLGRLELIRPLGAGGMGTVWQAHDPKLDRQIAVKLLRLPHPEASPEPLLDEARAMARLACPNVVTVHDAGVHPPDADRDGVARREAFLWIAMELVDGAPLDRWLAAAPREPRVVLDTLLAAGEGLASIHAADLVHGDVKPSNVLVDREGRPRVTDFGLSRPVRGARRPEIDHATGDAPGKSPVPVRWGTPTYMAPEQHRGAPASEASDQYAFCLLAVEALTGRRPRTDDDGAEREDILRRLPGALRAPLARGLEADPRKRHGHLTDLLEALAMAQAEPAATDTGHASAGPRRLRAVALFLALALPAVLAVALVVSPSARGDTPLCHFGPEIWEGTWDETRRQAVASRFQTSGLDDAAGRWARIEATLDDAVDAWNRARGVACRTASRDAPLAPGLEQRQMLCFHGRRSEVASLVDLLAEGEPGVLRALSDAAPAVADSIHLEGVMDPSLCREVPAPPGGEIADSAWILEAARVQDQARLRGLQLAGRHEDALDLAWRLATVEPAFLDLEARSLYDLGRLLEIEGRLVDAREVLLRAAGAADRIGADRLRARALVRLAVVLPGALDEAATDGDGDDGGDGQDDGATPDWPTVERQLYLARSSLFRVSGGPGKVRLASSLHHADGNARARFDLLDGSREQLAMALDLIRSLPLADHRPEASLRADLGIVLGRLGELDAADDQLRQALALDRERLGPGHPRVATGLHNLAVLRQVQGRNDEALNLASGALGLRRRAVERGLLAEGSTALESSRQLVRSLGGDPDAPVMPPPTFPSSNAGPAPPRAGLGAEPASPCDLTRLAERP